jgi:imidazole glycerol-phosphate synthase subunit HisH
MAIVIVDTGVANRHSIRNALGFIGCDVELTAEPDRIRDADKLIFPGVGTFEAGMHSLRSRNLIGLLREQVIERRKLILGICLGMQMMADASDEDGEHAGLGWISGRVRRLRPSEPGLKIPHIGFNAVKWRENSRLFTGLPQPVDFYFVHSYSLETRPDLVSGTAEYGGAVTAAVERDNIMGVQFHPEKSQAAGLQLLRNFMNLK